MITYWIITVVSFELQIKSRIGKEKSPMEKRKQKIKPKSLTQKKKWKPPWSHGNGFVPKI